MNLFTKQKQPHNLENELMLTGLAGRWGRGIVREFRMDMYTL